MYRNIPTKLIKFDPTQPRKLIMQSDIYALANNIKEHGLINAIEVDENYTIVTGERRFRACKHLKWKTVPCKIVKTDDKTFARQVSENIQQKPMAVMDEARAYLRLINYYKKTGEFVPTDGRDRGVSFVAQKMNISVTSVSNAILLLTAPEYLQEALEDGRLDKKAAEAIMLAPKELRREIFDKFMNGDFKSSIVGRALVGAIKRSPKKIAKLMRVDLTNITKDKAEREFEKIEGKSARQEELDYFNEVARTAKKLVDLLVFENPFKRPESNAMKMDKVPAKNRCTELRAALDHWLLAVNEQEVARRAIENNS